MAKHWKALLAAGTLALAVSQAHAADEQLIKRGEYLAIAGDCGACHTEEGKAPFSGGHAIASPEYLPPSDPANAGSAAQ